MKYKEIAIIKDVGYGFDVYLDLKNPVLRAGSGFEGSALKQITTRQ